MSDLVEIYLEFVCRIVNCLIEFVSSKEFVSRIVRCLIDLRAVKKFLRTIERCLIELRFIWSLFVEL